MRCALAATAATCVALSACSGSGKGSQLPNAQSPERQSDAEYDLARDLFQKGKPRQALDHARKATEINEDNDRAHYMTAAILMSFCSTNRGLSAPDCDLPAIEAAARASLQANPEFRDAQNFLGNVLILEKKPKDAIAVLEPLTKDPAYVQPYLAWGNLGWALTEAGQLDRAVSSLRNAVGSEPRFCVGHYRLGVALERKGDLPNAEASFTSAVTADPECAALQDAWEGRARVRVKLNKPHDARQDYARCVEISKETATGQRCVREIARLAAASQNAATLGGRAHAATASSARPVGRSAVNPNDARNT